MILLSMMTIINHANAQSCSFSISDINFGPVNILSNNYIDTTATLSIDCTSLLSLGTHIRICPNLGAGSGGSSGGTRTMLNGSATLQYQLYQDAARSIPWGAATIPALGSPPIVEGGLGVIGILLGGFSGTRTIYARILPGQASALGGSYVSVFSGGHVRINYQTFGGLTGSGSSCSSMNNNPTQVSFNIRSTVERNCTVSAQPLNFGSHGLLNSNVDGTGSLAINCTPGLAYSVSLNGGLSGGAPTERKMTLGSRTVIYGLYMDAARTVPWGESQEQILTGTGNGIVQNVTVYGRVRPQETPSPGTYSDTVVVTVTY